MDETPTDTPPPDDAHHSLTVMLAAYEGPLHTLLDLARRQKVDLREISISELADQYLDFIQQAQALRLEIAGDMLVMAAWLTYLKSQALLPAPPQDDDTVSADELAEHLAIRLKHLELMRQKARDVFALPQLQQDVYARGLPDGVRRIDHADYTTTPEDLVRAYATARERGINQNYTPPSPSVYALEEARIQLEDQLPNLPGWTRLRDLLPPKGDAPQQSYDASLLSAALELTKHQKSRLNQADQAAEIEIDRV